MKVGALREVFAALADPTRLEIWLVLDRHRFALAVLSVRVGVSVSTVNFHVRRLERCGLIVRYRVGRYLLVAQAPAWRNFGARLASGSLG